MRSYLLGTLEESSAAAVEERYFTDREYFLFVQDVETALIEDYLAGRLEPSMKGRFESRYLSVPELRHRLEEVQEERAATLRAIRQMHRTRLLQAAAILLVCIGAAAFWIYRNRVPFQPLPTATGSRPLIATLHLTPGVLKGEGAKMAQIASPLGPGDVRLALELPGQRTQILCSAQVSMALADGGWKRVWSSSQPVLSTPSSNGQDVVLTIDSSLLGRGDYMAEIRDVNQKVQETYLFRVSPM
ncbi:MAG TPA: hypothetical protein VIX89_01275 [Bryobacteraceae bacterium]